MTTNIAHWTAKTVEDFQYRIAADFVMQLEKRMEEKPTKSKELAANLGSTEGRVSQVLNNPGNLSLNTIIRYARALGMKVAVVAYDDNDPDNKNGPINSGIINECWKRCGSPRDYFELERHWEETKYANDYLLDLIKPPLIYTSEGNFSENSIRNPIVMGFNPLWMTNVATPSGYIER